MSKDDQDASSKGSERHRRRPPPKRFHLDPPPEVIPPEIARLRAQRLNACRHLRELASKYLVLTCNATLSAHHRHPDSNSPKRKEANTISTDVVMDIREWEDDYNAQCIAIKDGHPNGVDAISCLLAQAKTDLHRILSDLLGIDLDDACKASVAKALVDLGKEDAA